MQIKCALNIMDGDRVSDAVLMEGNIVQVGEAVALKTGVDKEDWVFDVLLALVGGCLVAPGLIVLTT